MYRDLEEIWDHAFQRCRKLKEIEIPENVRYIDDEAFLGCSGLRKIILKTEQICDDRFLPKDIREKVKIVYAYKKETRTI